MNNIVKNEQYWKNEQFSINEQYWKNEQLSKNEQFSKKWTNV